MKKLKIKVCGMRDPENIRELLALAPDYMGFIFYAPSKRYVAGLDRSLLASIPRGIKKTGVFVDATPEQVISKITLYGLDAVQLHGDEPPEMCIALRSYCEVIKVFSIDEGFSFQETEPYLNAADYFLFDTRTALKGGSGTRFSWNKLNGYVFDKPYFLSGGIGPEHIEELMNLSDLRLYAIDVNSRFETEPGIKDINKLTPVFNTLRSREERHEP